ncbi:MAG: hypothetical protein M0R17_03200 [Candidatus Omnitrophica bacterium]|jgi:hypothetical protein|nr:hypothetical protein [Candidatus Omnitrophota bacterium]
MLNNLIYTDSCCDVIKAKIKDRLHLDILLGLDLSTWTLNDSLNIIMIPNIKLAVINSINEVTVIEMGLLNFMCKPILVTSKNIKNYPTLEKRIINYVDYQSDLRINDSQFIEWYLTQGLI